jgi:hypothetical protein
VEPRRAIGVLPSDCKLEGGAMRNFSRGMWTCGMWTCGMWTCGMWTCGMWTCAALYVAIGLIGIFFLTGEPSIATSSEGYGIAAIASPAPLR